MYVSVFFSLRRTEFVRRLMDICQDHVPNVDPPTIPSMHHVLKQQQKQLDRMNTMIGIMFQQLCPGRTLSVASTPRRHAPSRAAPQSFFGGAAPGRERSGPLAPVGGGPGLAASPEVSTELEEDELF